MDINEIEQRIANAVNEIPLTSILQESKNKLETKLERYEENRKNRCYGYSWRLKALKLRKTKKTKEKCIDIGINCIRIGILVIISLFILIFSKI